nr:stage 0 sporulation family protein [Oscillospiraceae bacterium]
MIEVVSIKFKNRGKAYSFDPRSLAIRTGDKVVVETAKGLELADCSHGNHTVEDSAVVVPLRPVIRIATQDDLRVAEINKKREVEAVEICRKKIEEHRLDMKLVDAECSFEGNKITFFFTSEGRVDFRELVKDLAGIFRTRIELRQIGVRDEAKMVGGIAICGRPYCCGQFLEDFQPVSTKMAKVQSLSLNPTKISGSCGRLMCCLRYEQEAYEDLVKRMPRQGAFVETKDGYGTAAQVNLLRQTVKVKLDDDSDDTLHLYKSSELAVVPGGRPKDGEEPPHVLQYVPEPEEKEEEPEDEWKLPELFAAEPPAPEPEPAAAPQPEKKRSGRRRSRGRGGADKAA